MPSIAAEARANHVAVAIDVFDAAVFAPLELATSKTLAASRASPPLKNCDFFLPWKP